MQAKDADMQAKSEFLGMGSPFDATGFDRSDPLSLADISELPEKSKPAEMIQWVAANLRGDMNLSTCPGRDAFALMADCKQFPTFRLDFWKTMYTKVVPSRAQLSEDDGDDELDGTAALAVLTKIAAIAKKAGGRNEAEAVWPTDELVREAAAEVSGKEEWERAADVLAEDRECGGS